MLTGAMLTCSARRFPNKTAIVDGDRSITYRALDEATTRFANYLLDGLGLNKGDKLAILSLNRLEYGIAFLGAARSGVVLVNLSTMYGPSDLSYVLAKADCVALLYEDRFAELVARVAPDLPQLKHLIRLSATGEELFESISSFSLEVPDVGLVEEDPLCITFTGGTTGLPKGALVSHLARSTSAHAALIEEGLDERDVVSILTPMFHIAGLNLMFQPAIMVGATIVFSRKWNVQEFAELCVREKVTATFLVPTQVIAILNDRQLDLSKLASWKKLIVGGAPVSNECQTNMRERLPQVQITQIYGQTEIGLVVAMRPWHLPDKLGTCGRQVYNAEIDIVDPDGKPVPAGTIGEVVSRGNNVMIGYYNEPELTAKFFRNGDGWAWTGDLAKFDEDGFLVLVDRADDMIICGGVNIYPKEIENVLYQHPAVAECAVFDVPDEKWGKVPAAMIRLATGATATVEEIERFCLDQASRLKCPKLIEFVDEFPRTPVGKIQKNVLRERFARKDPPLDREAAA